MRIRVEGEPPTCEVASRVCTVGCKVERDHAAATVHESYGRPLPRAERIRYCLALARTRYGWLESETSLPISVDSFSATTSRFVDSSHRMPCLMRSP